MRLSCAIGFLTNSPAIPRPSDRSYQIPQPEHGGPCSFLDDIGSSRHLLLTLASQLASLERLLIRVELRLGVDIDLVLLRRGINVIHFAVVLHGLTPCLQRVD